MNIGDVQKFFCYSDEVDQENLRKWLHPDLKLTTINVGLPGPLNLEEYLEFLVGINKHHAELGESTKHIPHNVLIEGDFIAISGQLLHTYPDRPDEYSTYFDFWKLKDGKIIEYNIANAL